MYITEDNKTKIVDNLNKEITKILDHGELTKDTLHCLYEIVDVLKDMGEVDEKEMEIGGYSQRGGMYSQRMMPYSYNSYDRGNSYGGGSYNSYGSERDHMMNEFMSQASNDHERDLIRRIMNRM